MSGWRPATTRAERVVADFCAPLGCAGERTLNDERVRKGREFKDRHHADGILVMPNAWNAGSACMLEAAGFSAIGTTSAALRSVWGCLTTRASSRGMMLWKSRVESQMRLRCPSVLTRRPDTDTSPEAVAETIRRVAETGAVGASIEDFSASYGRGLYERDHAVERIKGAKTAADAVGFPFTLTARAECYLVGHENPFEESVARANAYREAGADCLYVPGVKDADTIAALVKEIDGPLNVVMGLAGNPLAVAQLAELGVKRVSIGGSLNRATFGLIRRAAEELRQEGTFGFAEGQLPDDELCRFFSNRISKSDASGSS